MLRESSILSPLAAEASSRNLAFDFFISEYLKSTIGYFIDSELLLIELCFDVYEKRN